MEAYKLFRLKKNGKITSLFINKIRELPLNTWINAEPFLTKGFAFRPGWHCTKTKNAPHLSKKGRIWGKVMIKNYKILERSKTQGGVWYLAKRIKITKLEDF